MSSKNILLCLEQLRIGGVETYAINQAIALKNKKFNVIIASKDGIYRKIAEEKGIKWIEFDFEIENFFNLEKIEKMMNIIKEHRITEVHMHTFVTSSVVFPACLMLDIPFFIYVHTGISVIEDNFEWFENTSIVLKENLKDIFKHAYRIVTINTQTIDFIKKRYNITDVNKFVYIRNSIDFEEYRSNKQISRINRVLIVSRMDELKKDSIKNGILFFQELNKLNDSKLELNIAGDGPEKEKIEEFITNNKIENVNCLGAVTNIKEQIEKSEIVIGVGRCVLEAIAMKRIAIISGYEKITGLVNFENIPCEIDENFVGAKLKGKDVTKLAHDINSMSLDEIKNTVETNYELIKEKLDINKNIIICDIDNYKYNINNELYKILINNSEILGKKLESATEKIENDWKEHLKYKDYMEELLEKTRNDSQGEIDRLTKEIRMYENSKPIRLSNGIKRVLGMKGKK